ncbi:MAG: transglutaminase family protein, partial [Gammaproteobacteria bacterium]
MAIRVAINHKTEYRFDRPVEVSPHIVRLRPAAHTRTPIEAYSLTVLPKEHFINWQQDPFGNYLARLVFPEPLRSLSFEVDLVAEIVVINPFDFFVEKYAEKYPFQYPTGLRKELAPYLEITEDGPLLTRWLSGVDRSAREVNNFLVDLNHRLERDIDYTIRMEVGIQSCEETLDKALGSCRDSAWLLVQILRHLGLAARFVSGYLLQLTPDEKPLEGPAGTDHDFTDLHAWAEVYLPGAGWLGLDPTSGLFAGEGHIPLACTPHPVSAAPITGATDECEVEFSFHNEVRRIHEDPRVTKPYSEDQWQTIQALGRKVDADLAAGDVRLTLGGEPTFVSIDDMESPQWNDAALGTHKRALAGDLHRRLWQQFAPGGLLHYGQGKWYPGEPIPRWSLNCFWRVDGEPLWRNPELLARDATDYGCGPVIAQEFGKRLARKLGLAENYLLPAYEDTLYYLWKEGDQPVNVDLLGTDLKKPDERRRLVQLLAGDLGKPAGYALPVRRDGAGNGWQSCSWRFRRGHMCLAPGDSPMGLRLPLDALPWVAEKERDIEPQRDPFETRRPLQDTCGEVARRFSHLVAAQDAHPEIRQQQPADNGTPGKRIEVIHTALCIEARKGMLRIFLPPLTHLEHYLDLLAAVELTAAEMKIPVRLEGYEPPRDWRLEKLAVTPDPGVIEVNIHPAHNWEELVERTEILYAEARLARLGTEKFMLDGRHTGTGGGNHVTLGGATPADSPFLRRPD